MADSVATLSGWERAALAAEKVKERLKRSTAALEGAGVLHAVAGGNAAAEWVGRVDEDAVRNTRDVDILIRRAELSCSQGRARAGRLRLLPKFWRRYVPRRACWPSHVRRAYHIRLRTNTGGLSGKGSGRQRVRAGRGIPCPVPAGPRANEIDFVPRSRPNASTRFNRHWIGRSHLAVTRALGICHAACNSFSTIPTANSHIRVAVATPLDKQPSHPQLSARTECP